MSVATRFRVPGYLSCARVALLLTVAVPPAAATSAAIAQAAPANTVTVAGGVARFPVLVTVRAPREPRLAGATGRVEPLPDELRSVVDALVASYAPAGLVVRQRYSRLPIVAVTVPAALLPSLADDPRVVGVTPSRRLHALDIEGQSLIHVPAVQAQGFTGRGVGIAVLDTGVDDTHAELSPGGTDASAKTVRLYDAIDHAGDTSDHNGHGTAVAGIAAGSETGVAPGATVVAVRVLDGQGSGTSEQVLDGIDAVLASVTAGNPFGIRVVNLSLGGYDPTEWPPNPGTCDSVAPDFKAAFDALNAAGITVAVAAGNGGCTNGVAFPACISAAIAVGAVFDAAICTSSAPPPSNCQSTTMSYSLADGCITSCSSESQADRVTCYSDSGDKLDLWAPADCAAAPRMGGGTWACFGGTSAAAPYASGVLALLAQAFPGANPALLRSLLTTTGTPVTDARNGITRGRVDALAALSTLQACPVPAVPSGLSADTREVCEGEPLALTWDAVGGVARYTVQLARDPTFATLLASYETPTPAISVSLSGLAPFTAYFRVRADAACGASSAMSEPIDVTYGGACGTAGRQTTFVPGIAHAPGVAPAIFYSDLSILNVSGGQTSLTLTFFGSTGTPQATAVLGPRQQVSWQDVLASCFGVVGNDVGVVEIDSSAPVEVFARTYSRPADTPDRSFGQAIPGLRADQALSAERVGYFAGLRSDNPFHAARPFRTNVLFANVGTADADVTVRFFSNGGALIGTVILSAIAPRQQKQASMALPGAYGSAWAEVSVSPSGSLVIGIASVVDGASTDPTTVPLTIP